MNKTDPELVEDLAEFGAAASRIVALGEEAFFDPVDDILRRAARSVIIDVATAVGAMSAQTRDKITDANAIAGMRNRLAHTYEGINVRLVWNVLVREVPRLLSELHESSQAPDD